MYDASNCFVSNNCWISASLIDKDIHSIRVFEVTKMEEILFFFQQINRIESISLPSSSIVDLFRSVSIKNGPFTRVFSEIELKPLSQSINEIRVDLSTDFNVILAENDALIVCGKQSCIVRLSENFEIERICSVLECNCRHVKSKSWTG